MIKSIVYLSALLALVLWSAPGGIAQPAGRNDAEEWGKFFTGYGVNGTFVLYNLNEDAFTIYNSDRASVRYLPASTFKIMNSLIGLQQRTVKNTDEIFAWDGIKRAYDSWNRDLSLREAFRISAVWVYQELAKRTGREAMEEWIVKCRYGNMKTGPEIDRFWLDGEIAISALEQAAFIKQLYLEELPFDKPVQQQVKQMMLTDSTAGCRLFAKTGWAARVRHQVGWYTGFVETPGNTWVFAINIDIEKEEDLSGRIGITRKILDLEGIFPED